jgi:hypothetical protein
MSTYMDGTSRGGACEEDPIKTDHVNTLDLKIAYLVQLRGWGMVFYYTIHSVSGFKGGREE